MFMFTQLPPQFVPEQTSWQLPFTQLVPFWQTVPQEPQLWESVFVFIQVLPQRIVPDGQIPADEGAPVGVGVEGAPVGVEVGVPLLECSQENWAIRGAGRVPPLQDHHPPVP